MLAKPSILHIITSKAWGGLELYVVSLVKKLLDEGFHTALYCLPNTKVELEARKLNIPIFHAKKQAHFSPIDLLRIKSILKQHNFNIIHTHTRQDVWLGSLSVLLSSKKKHIFSLYMSAPSKKDLIHRFIYSKVDAITSSSKILNTRILNSYPVPPQKVHFLPYGRDFSLYNRDEAQTKRIRAQYQTKDTDIVVASISRIDPAKGVWEFAQSLLLLEPKVRARVKYWIIGEPTLSHINPNGTPIFEKSSQQIYEQLLNFAKSDEVANQIQLIPFQRDLIPCLSAIQIFILATYKETYSLSVLDAMSMEIPVIGTNSGGTPEQIKHDERGILVAPKNAREIADAIAFYVKNTHKMQEYAQRAKTWVESRHAWENTLSRLTQLYVSL